MKKRIIAALLSAAMMLSTLPSTAIFAANTEETPDLQLQTILIDNDGQDWQTLSWGGATMTPNTNWTTLSIRDYYENGVLEFDVMSTADQTPFKLGLISLRHGQQGRILWTDMAEYSDLSASTGWTHYSLPIKALIDAFPDSDFDLDNFWYVYCGAVPSGKTLSFRNMKISSPDDERQYPMIKVNQVGYPTTAAKIARISCFAKFGSLEGKIYELVNADTDTVVFRGTIPAGQANEATSGETVHLLDFSEVTATGRYYIRVPNAGLAASARSPRDVWEGLDTDTITSVSFAIGEDVYDALLSDVTKYYYFQRQGMELEADYAGDFARENLHPDDAAIKKWSDRDNPNAETIDVSGGWYDAGDYGKYVVPAAQTVEDLLLAYDLFPEVFNEMALHIPENDPNHARYVDAPPLLNEVKYELDMLLKMEHVSKDGSFYVAANYKDGVIYMEDTLDTASNHQSNASEVDLRSHLATISMSAVLAHAYIIYRDIPAYADFAGTCLETAQRAWNWVNDTGNAKHMSIAAANRTYTFSEEELTRYTFWAAGALYRAMTESGGDTAPYEDYLLANCDDSVNLNCFVGNMSLCYGHGGEAFLGFFHYLLDNASPNAAIAQTFEKFDNWEATVTRNDSWCTTIPSWGYWWGSNINVNQNAMTLLMGSMLRDGKEQISETAKTAVENAMHYMLGVNPISFSYVSGHGENCVENIYSNIYSEKKRLEPYKIPAGYVTEGTNYYDNRHLSKFDGKCYIDNDSEYTTNENTIYGNAAFLLVAAAMASMYETDAVKGDVNADGSCTIADVVMMQKWMTSVPDATLTDWQAGDMNDDGKISVVDLCLLKRTFL